MTVRYLCRAQAREQSESVLPLLSLGIMQFQFQLLHSAAQRYQTSSQEKTSDDICHVARWQEMISPNL